MPLRPEDPSFLPQPARHRRPGFGVVTVNIGFGEQGPEAHLRMLTSLRHWVLAHPEEYLLLLRPQDVERAHASGRLAVGFDIEGANALGDQLSLIQLYYDQSPRFAPPEQLEAIFSTLQGWGYGDEPLKALLGGNLLHLARQVWKEPAHG